jgi:hypothetical protein
MEMSARPGGSEGHQEKASTRSFGWVPFPLVRLETSFELQQDSPLQCQRK